MKYLNLFLYLYYLDTYISDIYDDGCNDVELNDFLWFDFDTIENDRKEQY